MKIEVIGPYGGESHGCRLTCLVINDVIALDAAPIVPTAFIGSDDQAPILLDIRPLAKRLGIPMLPITPTFPWLGPLGLLPFPVSYRIVYGEPLRYHERFGPEGADDSRLVRYLANQVRRAVQLLLDRNR